MFLSPFYNSILLAFMITIQEKREGTYTLLTISDTPLKRPSLHWAHWARIEFKFFEELPQEWMGDIKLGLKAYGKQESFKS